MAYTPNEWGVGNLITASKMNKIERQLVANTSDLDDIRNGVTVPTYDEFETLRDDVAAEYDNTKTYAVGDYVIYNTQLYKCKTAITSAETWTVAHWDAVEVGEELQRIEGKNEKEVAELKSAFDDLEDAFDSVTTPEKEAITGAQTMSTTINNTKKVVDATAAYYTVSYTASAGDKFIVNGAASNNGYVYIFTDSNDDTLSRYPEQNTSGGVKNYSGLEVTAPTGTAHIIIASHTNYTPAYLQKITGYSVDGMDELDGRLDDIEALMTLVLVSQDVPSTDITLHDNHYMGSNGAESAEYTAWQYAEYAIPSNAVSLTVTGEAGQNAALWVLKNSSGTVLGASSWTSSTSLQTETINLASYTGAAKVFVSDKKSGHLAILCTYNVQRIDGDNVYVNGQELGGTVEDLDERVEDIEDVIIDVQIPQDVPAADITIHDNHYIGTSGSESAESSMWQYAEYTLPDGVASVRVTGAAGQLAPLWLLESATGTVIGYSSDSSAVSTKTETVSLATYTGAKKLFVNDKKSGALAIVLIYNGKVVDGDAVYIDGQSLPDVLDEISLERSDKLYGKILCCVGDSITYGADMDPDGITNTSRITVYNCNDSGVFSQTLSGFRKTWGWQIADRHDMTFYNGGVSGSTMQNVTGHAGFSAADGRYTKLPDNLDYLLIWFGWNDNAYGTLGTIADDDNDSYYGGYNVVLPYLLNKYTYAKIGLIVPFGASAGHREAIRLLGNKWGVAVWDNYQGGTPLYYGKEDSVGVEASVVTANRTKFQANGAHPNYKGHTQLADMIEEWLKGI